MAWWALLAAGCGGSVGPEHEREIPDAGPDARQDVGPSECPPARTGVRDAFYGATGVLQSADDAQGVAQAFGHLWRKPPDTGCGDDEPTGTYVCDCNGGGAVVVAWLDEDGSSVQAVYEYRGCCIGACCYDGCGWYDGYDEGPFGDCAAFSGTASCVDLSPVDLVTCGGAYLVEYNDESFAVGGTYDPELGGEWRVYDATTEWWCTQDETGVGSCTNGVDVLNW